MAEKHKYSPGPFTVRQPEVWPFDIEVVGPDGSVAWSERRYAHSTRQRSVADCMAAVGFEYDKRPEIIAAMERQLADITLRAQAPAMLSAAEDVLNYATLDDVLSNPKRHDNEVFGIRLGDLRKLRAAIAAATGEAP